LEVLFSRASRRSILIEASRTFLTALKNEVRWFFRLALNTGDHRVVLLHLSWATLEKTSQTWSLLTCSPLN
jgi:hypothetical protein